jgi:hypothetical protein
VGRWRLEVEDMRRTLLTMALGLTAMAQTQVDPSQLKRPIRTGIALPATCAPGDLFFKTDAPAGSNLYGCSANAWALQGGFPSQNCRWDATAQLLECQDTNGNTFTPVKTSAAGTPNQWVDYITPQGVAHTSQPSAAQVQNAVDQTANYSNPSWIASLAWGKLTGVPASFNAGQLLGRTLAGGTPADRQYLGWNAGASQWEPQTLPGGGVSAIFGRTGTITAQTGDYSFSQISGTVLASQLPAAAMRTDQGNTVTAGTQDFHNAAHTLPMKSGPIASLPTACSVGETYFATDAPAGNNVYLCTTAGTWTPQGGASSLAIASDGVTVGSRTAINFVTGAGLMNTVVDTGSQINVQVGLDTAVVQTQAGEQSGTALLCASAGGSASIYQCSMNPTLSGYTTGMVVHWEPDVNGRGGSTTLNIDQLGAAPVTLSDGATNPGASDIVAGQMYELWYDGRSFRVLTNNGLQGSGAVASVFGRTGTVTAQAGDYTASQITGLASVATSGSYNDLSNKPAIPAAQVNSDWNANSGAAQILNKPTLAAVATSGSYNDLANKPSIPSLASTPSLLKGDGMGNGVAATAGTDYMTSSTPVLPSQLPMPGSSTLGGIRSKDCTGVGHVLKIGTDGTVTCSADAGAGGSGMIASTTTLLKGDGAGNAVGATAGTDYLTSSLANTFGAPQTFSGSASLGSSFLSTTKTAGAGGVTGGKLCKIDSTGNVVVPAAGDVSVLGVCIATTGGGGTVEVATRGIVACVADNATTVGNVAIVGTTTGGACGDSGQASATNISNGTQVIGKILTAVTAGQPVSIQLYGPGHYGTQIPKPTSTSIGGVQAKDCSATGAVQKINTDGSITCTTAGAITTSQGPYASAPGSCNTGDMYYPTNSVYQQARCSTPNMWSWFYDGKLIATPDSLSLTSSLQSGVSVNSTRGIDEMSFGASGATTRSYRYWTAPSAPYTRFIGLRMPFFADGSNYRLVVAGFMDGTGAQNYLECGEGSAVASYFWCRVSYGTNGGGSGSDASFVTDAYYGQPFGTLWFVLGDDGSNLTFGVSSDGISSVTLATVSRTAHFTSGPTRLFYGGMNSAPAYPITIGFIGAY